jgi:acetyl-CoA synthetase
MSLRAIVRHDGMSHQSLRERFRWRIPERFNLGAACSDAHRPEDPALITEAVDGSRRVTTYGDLSRRSNRLARHLEALGVGRGDRVGVIVPQSEATGLAHLATWKLGAISLPLASLFGPDALAYRLGDADVAAVITSPENAHKLIGLDPKVQVVTTGNEFDTVLDDGEDQSFRVADTAADDPAYLIYTSGTTGQPKGALHAHRSLHGHLPGFELYYEFAPQSGDVIWTPADWAWIGGLMDVLVPAWYFGMTVLTVEHDFDPQLAVDVMARHRVTLAFVPPTGLKMMRAAGVGRDDLSLRAIFTGGEPLGEELLQWARRHLGVGINEGYGQTECNLVLGNCGSVWPVRPGSMGRPLPGHDVAVMDDAGRRLVGEPGEVCVRAPDPVMMLHYWNRPEATAEKFRDGWLRTGDLGIEDEDGYFWFVSRKDDVISSMGYRIGPGEIEESLLGHPAVAMCAVIGVPDEIRGQVPAAFVVVRDGYEPGDGLVADLQQHVRTRLAAHEVPRRITFMDDLPRTTTGKIMRRALRDHHEAVTPRAADPPSGG